MPKTVRSVEENVSLTMNQYKLIRWDNWLDSYKP
jgi:hypothetical protein